MALNKSANHGSGVRAGFKKNEFQAVIGLANQFSAIRDCRPIQQGDHITIYLHQCACKQPSIWIEKYQNGPDKALFIAFTQGSAGQAASIARSEKFSSFLDQIRAKLTVLENSSSATHPAQASSGMAIGQGAF